MDAPRPSHIALLFPLWAVLMGAAGYLYPALLGQGKMLIVPLLVVIMFGMGLTLKPADFKRALGRWPVVLLGLGLQFGLMPAMAWLIANGLDLPATLMLGMILVGSVAGGTSSNVLCFLAGGDVALSITLTSLATLLSIVATPLLVWFWADAHIDVPIVAMLVSIAEIVLLPVMAGMLVNKWLGRRWPERDGWCALLSALVIGLVIGIIVALNVEALVAMGIWVLVAVILHNITGMAAGLGLSWLATRDHVVARTIAIEVGMQNSALAVALAEQYFSMAAALPGAVFSIWHNLAGAATSALCRRWDQPDRIKTGDSGL